MRKRKYNHEELLFRRTTTSVRQYYLVCGHTKGREH